MKPDGLRQAAGVLFSIPIPIAVLEKLKADQDEDFASVAENLAQDGNMVLFLPIAP